MSDHPIAFFHHQQLAAAFMQCAARALGKQQINQQEHTWLETLLTGTASSSGRIDLLSTEDGSDPPELTATLMFSDPGSTVRRVFLQNPVYGLEAFEDRATVDHVLRQRFILHDTTLEAPHVQGDVFTAQMNDYLSKRAKRLARTAEELARLPTLEEQIGDSPTVAGSATLYNRALNQFWKTATAGSKHLHQLASKAFAEGFYQDLAQARLADISNPLLQLDPDFPPLQGPALHCEKILVRLGSEWVELAGAFTLSLKTQSEMLLYWPTTGLQSLSGEGALHACLDALAIPMSLPLNHVRQWNASTSRVYRRQTINRSVFVDRIDSIVTVQELNLAYALSVATNDIPDEQITVDDAINLCTLIDRRLGMLDPALRWNRSLETRSYQPLSTDTMFNPLLQSMDRLMWLASERDAIYGATPSIRAVAVRLLNPVLAVFEGFPKAETTLLQPATPEQPARANINLVDLLLQRVSGYFREPISDDDTFIRLDGQHLPSLAPAALEQTLNSAAQVFGSLFTAQLKGSGSLKLCLNDRWLSLAALLRTNLEDGIRLEMVLHEHFMTLPPLLLQRLKQVFEKPLASQRQVLGTQAIRVSGLQLNLSAQTPGVRLGMAFIVDQPGAADRTLLFWSPLEGLRQYADLQQLGSALISNLATGPRRDRWQNLLPVTQIEVWQPWLQTAVHSDVSISTWSIDGNTFDELHANLLQEQNINAQTALDFAISDQVRPGIFAPLIDTINTQDGVCEYLEALSVRFIDLHTRQVLPDWLNQAGPTEFEAFSALLQDTLEMGSPQNSYLSGIPTIDYVARKHLQTRLNRDFAASNIDPDALILNLKSFIATPVSTGEIPSFLPAFTHQTEQSLTQSAIDHFSKNMGAMMVIRRADGMALPAGLTPDYVRQLIRELDIGGTYLTLLNQSLSPDNKEYSQRLARFSAMASNILKLSSLQHVLQDGWSRTMLAWIQAILEMPDGVARQPVAGQDIIFSRLQLGASADATPDRASGVYVICPAAEDQGPVIVFTAYTPEDSLRLYPGRAELLVALQTDPVLQTQLLARLHPDARHTYDNGGWVEPHIHWNTESSFDIFHTAPGPARLQIAPLTGNALTIMFEDMIVHVKEIARTQSVTSAQAQWRDFTHLMTLGFELASAFLPGRIAVLVNIWQAKSWVGAATGAVRNSQWGKALSEFATALALLASTRSANEPEQVADSSIPFQEPAKIESGRLLRSFEERNVALTNLDKDIALPIYRTGQTAYAAVEGRVYQIVQHDEQWHIFTGPGHPGPKIRLNAERHWILDQRLGLYGGGIGSSKIDVLGSASAEVDLAIKASFAVKSKGMKQIRSTDLIKARQITAAHTLALNYLRNSLVNLDSDTATGFLPPATDLVIQAAFNLPVTPPSLTRRLRNLIADIYVDMLSPSMSPKTSTRYITGSHKKSDTTSDAFVYRADPARRVFLADSFFNYVPRAYPTVNAHLRGFYPRTHFQAAALIHELSHLNNQTADIAYVDSGAPYADLISAEYPQAQAQLLHIQNNGLARGTPRDQLFKVNRNGTLSDLDEEAGYGFATILKLTKTTTLEEARNVFYSDPLKRCDVMLANADTIALLVTKLGRVPFD